MGMFVSSYNALILPYDAPSVTSLESLSTDANDASSDQLLDLRLDTGVLHVLTEGSRVGLSLLQNGLHDRVLHDSHDLV